jgi:hypothetical protein
MVCWFTLQPERIEYSVDGPVNWQCPASFDDAEQIEHILHPPCVVVLVLIDVFMC